MYEKSIMTTDGTLYYVEKENRITITTYHGNDVEVVVPEEIDGVRVRKIGKKAFMNSRKLQKVTLPDTIKKIGEWAFAYCANLEQIEFPKRKVSIGTGAFLGDKRLEKIWLRSRKKDQENDWQQQPEALKQDMAVLLATVPVMQDAEHLYDLKEVGNEEWIQMWDARLLKILEEPDEKGYTEMILCGEEDINCNLENFVRDKRKKKVRYCFLRLLHASGMEESTKITLENYLISHIVGCPSMETWLVLKEEKGHLREYYECYVELGCLTEDNYNATLADLGEKHPEMKAYFMRYHDENKSDAVDAFDAFSL